MYIAFSDTPHSKRQDVEIWMATDSDDIVLLDILVNVMLELDTFLSRRRNVTPSIEELTPPGDYDGKHKLHKIRIICRSSTQAHHEKYFSLLSVLLTST